jgi:hypothetical protein
MYDINLFQQIEFTDHKYGSERDVAQKYLLFALS